MIRSYNWVGVLNEAWQSPLNPIEYYIGYIKRHYYKNKVKLGANPNYNDKGKNLNEIFIKRLIDQTLRDYSDFDCTKIIKRCKSLIN